MYIYKTYYKPQDAIQRKIESLLESEPIPYFVQRPELIVRPITATTKVIRVNDIFPSKLPSYFSAYKSQLILKESVKVTCFHLFHLKR